MPGPSARLAPALRRNALSIACFALFAAAQLLLIVTSWVEFADTQGQHGQPVRILGDDGFAWTVLQQTIQNWQSEFLALAMLIALTSMLRHVGSKHSRDGSDEVHRRVLAIRRRVDKLEGAGS